MVITERSVESLCQLVGGISAPVFVLLVCGLYFGPLSWPVGKILSHRQSLVLSDCYIDEDSPLPAGIETFIEIWFHDY